MILGIDASRAVTTRRTGTEAYALHLLQSLVPRAVAAGHRVRLYFNAPGPEAPVSLPADPLSPGDLSPGAGGPTAPGEPIAGGQAVGVPELPAAGDMTAGLRLGDLFPDRPGVEAVYLPFPRLWTHVRLARELRQRPPDLFFTPAHVIPASYRGRAVATVHDLGFRHYPGAHPRSQLAYLSWSTRHNARRSRLVLADSQATREDLVRFYQRDPEHIVVVYPGPTPGLAPVSRLDDLDTVRRKYGFRGDYLLFLGTLQPRKNLVRLIRVYDRYVAEARGPVQRLVLAGQRGWLADDILEAIVALPFPRYTTIHLPGYVDENDKAALLSGATALVFPSLYEGFGFPILEAQLCGTPVLTADNSSLPEVAGDGALLVPAEDDEALLEGLRRIIADGPLRQRLIARGFANTRRFSWSRTAEQCLAVLEAAVA